MDSFEAGKTFRLKNDPGRKGILTGKDALFAGLRRLQVRFFDGSTEWVPEDQLEVVEESDDDPLSLLEKGRLSRSQDLRRTLLHARLSGRLTNVIYSMDTAGADFYAYQFKPLVKLLNSANRGILIADEVGLGKTIEAGLIWTELRFRFDYRRLLVVCPSMLRGKWERELRRRFGLKPENADASRLLALLQQAEDDPDATRFAAIASLQGIRPPRDWGELEETTGAAPTLRLARFLEEKEEQRPLIDLVVIDEAHSMRNPDTASAAAGRLFRGVTEHLVLLSATPVHLRSADLFQLVNLVDPDTFARAEEFDYLLSANAPLVRARDLAATGRADSTQVRRELESAAAHPLLRQSEQIAALLQSLPTDGIVREPAVVVDLVWRIENVNLLGHAITRTRKRDVKEWQVLREAVAEAIEPSALEGEFYGTVTRTVREYCARAGSHSGFLLVSPQRQMTSSMAAALRAWSDAVSDDPDLAYQDIGMVEPDDDDSLRPLRAELLRKACTFGSYQALRSSDSKYDRLRTLLTAYFGEHPGEKVVLFAFFKQTLFYLAERLREDGVRTALLHGDTEDKDGAIEAFRNAPGGTVLLSSEVGSEGVDLQF
jgi:SNF2 family DNA or RNA helicase